MTKVIAMKLHEHIRLIMADVWHAPHVAAVHGMHSTQFMHLPVGHFEGGVKSVWAGASHVGASYMSN